MIFSPPMNQFAWHAPARDTHWQLTKQKPKAVPNKNRPNAPRPRPNNR